MVSGMSGGPSMQQRRGSQSVRQTNQPSRLLNASENNHLFQLIGSRCVTLASAVVQIYMGEGGQWVKYCCGVLTFIKDNLKRSYYLRVYDLKLCQCIWEQEMYNNFQYKTPKPFFHTFDSEECPAGVNFANEEEANAFRNAVLQKLDSRQQRRNVKKTEAGGAGAHLTGSGQARSPGIMMTNAHPGGMKAPPSSMPVSLNLPPSSHSHSMTSLDSGTLKKDKKDKKKGKLTKADIGTPSDFRHVSHVGWNPETGFDVDNLDPALKSLFDEAGVTANDLKDKETAAVIYDFIEQHGGMEVIKQRHQRPPPPPASVAPSRPLPAAPVVPPTPPSFHQQRPPPPPAMTSHNSGGGFQAPPPPRRDDPPPPPRTVMAPPPPPQRVPPAGPPPVPPPLSRPAAPAAPPPPPPQAPPPAPPVGAPPPPPPIGGLATPAPPPPPPGPPPPPAMGGGGRGGLLAEIQEGKTLRHRDAEERSADPPDERSALLDSIRTGISLNKVDRTQLDRPKSTSENGGDGLAGALARALASRAKNLHADDEDDEEDDDDDDDWED